VLASLKGFFFIALISSINMTEVYSAEKNRSEQSAFYLEDLEALLALETEKIQELEKGCDEIQLYEAYNERGMTFFLKKEYKWALRDFDFILEGIPLSSKIDYSIFGAALWGRALSRACLGMGEAATDDLLMLCSLIDHFQIGCCEKSESRREISTNSFSQASVLLCASDDDQWVKYANPHESISSRECRNRVFGTANALKNFLTPLIKDPGAQVTFMYFIDLLTQQGYNCCHDGSIWATCVKPLLAKLNKWRAFGIPADPYWD